MEMVDGLSNAASLAPKAMKLARKPYLKLSKALSKLE
jgi:hypothetical protein